MTEPTYKELLIKESRINPNIEGTKDIVTGIVEAVTVACPPAGAALGAMRGKEKGIGKMVGNQDAQDVGEAQQAAMTKPIEDIKKIFD
ncbi:hypothetical protein G9A89_007240 [Geosiphon pyriformis]|nr:hypothetical protein G9A89_007240 [Geosiphon pyriformis]